MFSNLNCLRVPFRPGSGICIRRELDHDVSISASGRLRLTLHNYFLLRPWALRQYFSVNRRA